MISWITAIASGVPARPVGASLESTYFSKLAPTGLAGTPEAIAVIQEITRHYYGDENAVHHQGYKKSHPKGSDYLHKATPAGPDQVDTAIAKLDKIRSGLVKDVALVNAGKWPENLLAIAFYDAPATV